MTNTTENSTPSTFEEEEKARLAEQERLEEATGISVTYASEDKTREGRELTQFVAPPARNVRAEYRVRVDPKPDGYTGAWPRNRVVVEHHHPDGTVEDIYTYDRNYSMMRTFEPFRQLHNGVWTDYALISTSYTSFEVLNLETRQIQAKLAPPTVTQAMHDRWRAMGYEEWCEKDPVGTPKPGHGFCPVDFYVPDFLEEHSVNGADLSMDLPARNPDHSTKMGEDGKPVMESRWLYEEDDLLGWTGQFAFYMGCHWGDDSSWKLRYIDLSRIAEGIVTEDDRFGYLEYGGSGSLRENIEYWSPTSMTVPTLARVNPQTGKAYPMDLNWKEEEED